MRYPIRGLGRLSAATLPKGCAGWNCHQLAPRVSDPADIHGGNAVAVGRHSEVHDALSVRTYALVLSPPLAQTSTWREAEKSNLENALFF
jgi:hypothetical protein